MLGPETRFMVCVFAVETNDAHFVVQIIDLVSPAM